MTHIHVPDGVLPTWLVIAGWVATAILLSVGARSMRANEPARRVPMLGMVSALMLVAMSFEIVPLAYHLNLTVVAGALLGPAAAFVSAFVVATVLALLGHGGVSVIGLNAALLGAEIALGWGAFTVARRFLARRDGPAAGVATLITLAITTSLLVAMVALANVAAPGVALMEEGAGLSVGRFAGVVFVLGPLGWMLEAVVTGIIIGYVGRVRPAMLSRGATPSGRRILGDEAGGH
jgi:cobalt/nickel transport system permease protein